MRVKTEKWNPGINTRGIGDILYEAISAGYVKTIEYSYPEKAGQLPRGFDTFMCGIARGQKVIVTMNGNKFRDKSKAPDEMERNREATERYQSMLAPNLGIQNQYDINQGIYDMTLEENGRTGWISRKEQAEDRRDDLRAMGYDPDDHM